MSKPIVIFPGSGDKITLTKEEFETYLQQAYDAGFEDGKGSSGTPVITHPYNPYNPPSTIKSWPPEVGDWPSRPIIYCKANTFDYTVGATEDRE